MAKQIDLRRTKQIDPRETKQIDPRGTKQTKHPEMKAFRVSRQTAKTGDLELPWKLIEFDSEALDLCQYD